MKHKSDPKFVEEIRVAPKPFDAFKLGQERRKSFNNNWDDMKELVMLEGLKMKFVQNINLQKQLLETESARLIENSPKDSYWGVGKKGNG